MPTIANYTKKKILQKHMEYAKKVIVNNGVNKEQYQEHLELFNTLDREKKTGVLNENDINKLMHLYGDVLLTTKTLLGLTYNKPHGYAGDFEIIEKIYTNYISNDPKFQKYDAFYQALAPTQAVRNRKTYFKAILKEKSYLKRCDILNLASGPCRDLTEAIQENSLGKSTIECVDLDKNAIQYAKKLVSNHPSISFKNQNVLKFLPNKKYDLIWSAGLFDYFNDKYFVRILNRYLAYVEIGGEIIIGNFHPRNPARSYMEIAGKWFLHHRTSDELINLAISAGVQEVTNITVEEEELGVNLFMRIRK